MPEAKFNQKVEVEAVQRRNGKVVKRVYETNKSFAALRKLWYKIKHLIER